MEKKNIKLKYSLEGFANLEAELEVRHYEDIKMWKVSGNERTGLGYSIVEASLSWIKHKLGIYA